MRLLVATFLLTIVCAVTGAPPAAQQPASAAGQSDQAAAAFVAELKRATAAGDRQALAALMRFPLITRIGGLRVPVDSAGAFRERFDAIFTAEVRSSIASADPARITVASDRLTIGGNTIVARRIAGKWAVVEIVVPAPGSSRTPAAPRRISVRSGPNPTQMSGSLGAGATDSYLVRVVKGQLLEVRIEGVRGREVLAHVANASSGAPVDARAKSGARVWSGRVPADGDYRIDVVRTKSGGDVLTYTLSVRLR